MPRERDRDRDGYRDRDRDRDRDHDRDRDFDDRRRGGGPGGPGGGGDFRRRNRCRFCRDKVTFVDYKDIQTLQKQCSSQGKLLSRKRSHNCAKHQRLVKRAVKRARFMALMPFVG